MDVKKIFSNNLKRLIDESGKERKDIAFELGYSYSTFTDWVNGSSIPNVEKIENIAKYFGVLKSDLIENYDGEFAAALGKLLATDDDYLKKLVVGISRLTLQEKAIVSKTFELFVEILKQ